MHSALDEYREVSPKGTVDFLYRLSDLVQGKSFLHLNAVRYGGGMSEVLRRLVPMMLSLGVEARWEVLAGSQEYFVVVTRMLNALQGRDDKLTDDMYQTYAHVIERNAKALKLEVAADYLVMAAWLAYLKSGLLLPKDPEIEPSPEELALRLQLRLERLNAMREAGARLMARDRLGRDVFARSAPEGLRVVRKALWDASLFELIQAYGHVKARAEPPLHIVHQRNVLTLEEAIERVSKLVGSLVEWTVIQRFLPDSDDPQFRKSALASSFLATLELARQGRIALRQEEAFAPLYVRAA